MSLLPLYETSTLTRTHVSGYRHRLALACNDRGDLLRWRARSGEPGPALATYGLRRAVNFKNGNALRRALATSSSGILKYVDK
jgi:hypothetical protein